MKKGEPLRRTTPLRSNGKGLTPGKPLARGSTPLRRSAPVARSTLPPRRAPSSRSTPAPDPVGPDTRAAVATRSGGRCEAAVTRRCAGVGQHVHHRKLRRYGDHRACNLLHVCWACHGEIHNNPAWAYEYGYLVRGHDDPAAVPWGVAA